MKVLRWRDDEYMWFEIKKHILWERVIEHMLGESDGIVCFLWLRWIRKVILIELCLGVLRESWKWVFLVMVKVGERVAHHLWWRWCVRVSFAHRRRWWYDEEVVCLCVWWEMEKWGQGFREREKITFFPLFFLLLRPFLPFYFYWWENFVIQSIGQCHVTLEGGDI